MFVRDIYWSVIFPITTVYFLLQYYSRPLSEWEGQGSLVGAEGVSEGQPKCDSEGTSKDRSKREEKKRGQGEDKNQVKVSVRVGISGEKKAESEGEEKKRMKGERV